jgi:hypothetical protein
MIRQRKTRAAILAQCAVGYELRLGEALSASKHEERTLSHSPQEGTLKPIFA